MCGIAGVYSMRASAETDPRHAQAVETMMRAIGHRGPDGRGVYEDIGICIGHLRLSILDLENGQQPISNEDGSLVIVYNGELYGFQDLRESLMQRHVLRTRTDTEVIVHLYEDVDGDVDDAIEGMYAYALYDRTNRRLRLSVDPFGIKPLYYAEVADVLLFCSELRGLTAGLREVGAPVEVDHDAIAYYLEHGWCASPHTLVAGVRKLAPDESLLADAQGIRRVAKRTILESDAPHEVSEERLDAVLARVVGENLVADVDVGLFLSGGIDSSLLLALAVQAGYRPKTFTARFVGNSAEAIRANEADVAAEVAGHYGTEHFECVVEADTLLESLEDCLQAMDEPIADPAVLPLLKLSEFARSQVKVCLSGDGGDEMFAGYERHAMLQWRRRYQSLPMWLRGLGRSSLEWIGALPGERHRAFLRRLQSFEDFMTDPAYVTGPFSGRNRRWIQAPTTRRVATVSELRAPLDILRDDLHGQLAGQMLPKTDRISMWTSLEVRVPFLDRRVLGAASRIPWTHKVAGRRTKVVLRKMLSQYLPAHIAERPKHGFRVPLSGWFRGPLSAYVRERLLDAYLVPERVMPRSTCEKLLAAHGSGREEHSARIWALLALNHWLHASLAPDSVRASTGSRSLCEARGS